MHSDNNIYYVSSNKYYNSLKLKVTVWNSVQFGITAYCLPLFRDFTKLLLPIWRGCGLRHHEGQKHKSVQRLWLCEV